MAAVVVGFVPTPEGQAALRRGIDEARLRGSPLVVVTSRRGGRGYDDEDATADEQALADVRTELADQGLEHDVRHVVRGREPAEDLLEVAAEVGATLLVIGMRKRTPVGKLLIGSNAQRILLEAEMPVLAVKADDS